jgi:predicted histidine transporter YuiF (NhaC family)
MFANLFKRAEASVDSAIGDLGNRVIIAIPFLAALGFGAASLTFYVTRIYGPEIGNLIVAGAFCLVGFIIALVVKVRKQSNSSAAETTNNTAAPEENAGPPQSMLDDETIMSVMTSAAPIILPAVLRTGLKNWPIILAALAGLYVFSRSDQTAADTPTDPSAKDI